MDDKIRQTTFAFIAMAWILLLSGCIQNTGPGTPMPPVQPGTPAGSEMMLYPSDYLLYLDYLSVTGNKPNVSDIVTIEATVVSINDSEICPYYEETCSMESYPKDSGTIKVDKILNYQTYEEQTAQKTTIDEGVSNPPNDPLSKEIQTSDEYRGKPLTIKKPEYLRLEEDQTHTANFLITARPVKINYVSVQPTGNQQESDVYNPADANIETAQPEDTAISTPASTTTTSSKTSIDKVKVFQPIPKENGYFVFTTKIIEYPNTSQKTLPGLKEGDRFRATISYNGVIYIEEYELIT